MWNAKEKTNRLVARFGEREFKFDTFVKSLESELNKNLCGFLSDSNRDIDSITVNADKTNKTGTICGYWQTNKKRLHLDLDLYNAPLLLVVDTLVLTKYNYSIPEDKNAVEGMLGKRGQEIGNSLITGRLLDSLLSLCVLFGIMGWQNEPYNKQLREYYTLLGFNDVEGEKYQRMNLNSIECVYRAFKSIESIYEGANKRIPLLPID